jgi:hypothetical protein
MRYRKLVQRIVCAVLIAGSVCTAAERMPAVDASFFFQEEVLSILEEFGVVQTTAGTPPLRHVTGAVRGAILAALAERGILPTTTPGIVATALTDTIRLKVGQALLVLGRPNFTDLADGSVTNRKLAPSAVSDDKIAGNCIDASKINSLPAGPNFVLTADGSGNAVWQPITALTGPTQPGQTITVASSGANFTTIQAAINSVTDASATKPYVILVYPGIYNETLTCKDFVHLSGFGSVEYGGASVVVQGTNRLVTLANCNIANIRFNLNTGDPGPAIKLIDGENGNFLRGAFSNCYFVVDGDYGASFVKFAEQNGNGDMYFENCSLYYRPTSSAGSTCFDGINGTINCTNLYMNHFLPSGNGTMTFWHKGANSGPANGYDEINLIYFREYPKAAGLTLFRNDNTLAPILINGLFGIPPATFPGAYTAGPGTITFNTAAVIQPQAQLASTVLKNANYTATAGDYTIRVDASAAVVAISLPPAASVAGQVLKIKKIDASVNAVQIQANGAETIDGQNVRTIAIQYGVLTVQSNGASWDGL